MTARCGLRFPGQYMDKENWKHFPKGHISFVALNHSCGRLNVEQLQFEIILNNLKTNVAELMVVRDYLSLLTLWENSICSRAEILLFLYPKK